MHETTGSGEVQLDDINVRSLLSIFWSSRWLIISTTLIFSILCGVAALVVPKSYEAATVIAPVSNTSGGALSGLSSLASQFGGLASLAGVSVPGDSKKYESIAILQSESLTEKYISINNLLPILFASKWDSAGNKWINTDPAKIPTVWQANQYFKKIRTISTDAKTGLVTLAIHWKDPKIAALWANDLVKLTNEYLRDKAIHEAETGITYLNEQANKTDVVAVKQGIYSMLQGEINKIMMAKGTDEYALRVIDRAYPPERPYSPQPIKWIIEGFLTGFLLSLLFVFNRRGKPRPQLDRSHSNR